MSEHQAEYVTDAPIMEPPQDRFSRTPFAERIAHAISTQRDPASLVIGLYGPWGDGKTSVLNLVEHALAGSDEMVPIRFNPWRLGSETEMFVGFFETLAEALDASLTTGAEMVGDVLKRYGGLLKPIPLAGGVVGEAAVAAGNSLSESNLTKKRERIEELLAEGGKRVVILMDDIDRLDKAEIQAIFRLVKVAADFKHTAYVLAFDASVVADALAERYAEGTIHGTSFLEKIIQLPLHLPPVGPELLREVTLETVDVALEQAGAELSKSEAGDFVSTFDRAVVPRIRTPRMGKRYGNAILFALPMIGDEVHPGDLLLIEAMRIFYPRLYEWVRTHEAEVIGFSSLTPGMADETKALLREMVAEAATGMTESEVQGAQVLLTKLFPRTESAWQNKVWESNWDLIWAKERRIASSQYFRRYFTYTVPAGDVRDADVDALIDFLTDPDYDADEAADRARIIIDDGHPEAFFQKIASRLDAVPPESAGRLVVLIASFSAMLSDQSGFLGLSTMERAALLASKAVERLAPDERFEVVAAVVTAADSIPFAVDLLRWVQPRDGEVKSLSPEETVTVGKLLVERIVPVWEGDDAFATLGMGVPGTLHTWAIYGDLHELRLCLARLIDVDIANAFRLMGAFLGQSWSLDTGVPLMPEFRREAYNAVVEYVDAADLFSRLQEIFGDSVGDGDFYSYRELPAEQCLSNQFAFIHRVVMGEEGTAEEPQGEAAPS